MPDDLEQRLAEAVQAVASTPLGEATQTFLDVEELFFVFFFWVFLKYNMHFFYSMSSEWIRSSDWSFRDLGFASSIDLFTMGGDGLHRAHLCCVYPWQPFWCAQGVSCLCWGRGAVRGQWKRSCFDEIASGQWLWDGVSVAVFGCVWHVEFGILFSLSIFHLGLRG